MLRFLLLVVVVAIVAVVAFFVALAARSRQQYAAANEIVPGVESRAPKAWAGAHSPEAKLHRRLRDVMVALRAIPGLEAASGRADVERLALDLDDRLVMVAALPEAQRAEPLARIGNDVARLEAAVGALVAQVATEQVPVEQALAGLSQQLGYLADARAELEAMSAPSELDLLAARPDPDRAEVPVPPPGAPAPPAQVTPPDPPPPEDIGEPTTVRVEDQPPPNG